MIERILPQVSSYAADVDFVIGLIAVIVFFWFVLAQALFFGFVFKFRAKPGVKALDIDGYNPKHKRWITYPHNAVLVCDVLILVFAVRVWNHVKIDLPPAEDTVRVIGQRWAWTFVHAGPDGKIDTADDIYTADELHVKQGAVTHFIGTSKDVLHSFSVPVFRLKQDVIPGRENLGWFKAEKTGTYDIQCAEICGIGHGIMFGRVVVQTPEEHAAWMAANAPKTAAAPAPAAPPPAAPTTPAAPAGDTPANPPAAPAAAPL